MKAFWTILMLVFSNVLMTFAWYGHLKLNEMKISDGWPLILVILFSWGIAFFEYSLLVPANRIGFVFRPTGLASLVTAVLSTCCN